MYPTYLAHHFTQSALDWNLPLPFSLFPFLLKLDFHTMYFHNILFPPRASQLSAYTILFPFLTLTISYMSILNLGHFYSILPSLPPFSLLTDPPFPTRLSFNDASDASAFFFSTEFNQGCWHKQEWGLFTRAWATFQLFHYGRKWQSSLNMR